MSDSRPLDPHRFQDLLAQDGLEDGHPSSLELPQPLGCFWTGQANPFTRPVVVSGAAGLDGRVTLSADARRLSGPIVHASLYWQWWTTVAAGDFHNALDVFVPGVQATRLTGTLVGGSPSKGPGSDAGPPLQSFVYRAEIPASDPLMQGWVNRIDVAPPPEPSLPRLTHWFGGASLLLLVEDPDHDSRTYVFDGRTKDELDGGQFSGQVAFSTPGFEYVLAGSQAPESVREARWSSAASTRSTCDARRGWLPRQGVTSGSCDVGHLLDADDAGQVHVMVGRSEPSAWGVELSTMFDVLWVR